MKSDEVISNEYSEELIKTQSHPVVYVATIIRLMAVFKHFIQRIPFLKVLLFLVFIGAIQFVLINLKVWRVHPTEQSLHEFILGKWIAVHIEDDDLDGLPVIVDFFDANSVYFEQDFPEIYLTTERNYKLNGNTIDLSPPTRLLVVWHISRAGDELLIGDVTYHRSLNLPWGILAVTFLICGFWGIKFTSGFQSRVKVVSKENSINLFPSKWANIAGIILTPVLAWIGFEIGLEGYALTRTFHWRDPWASIYALELLIPLGLFIIQIFKPNWKLRISDIVNPWVSLGFLLILIVATSVFFFSLLLVSWVLLGN